MTALSVPVFGQRDSECGNTSLKAVLWFHGRRVSARRLAHLTGLTTDGVDHAGVVHGALAIGARVYERSRGTLAELRWFCARGLPAIVGWWSREPGDEHFDPRWQLEVRKSRDCGHYSVVTGVAERVTLMDPQWRLRGGRWQVVGRRSMSRREFLNVWYDTDTPRYRRVERWYVIVHFSGERFADRFGGGTDHVVTRVV